MTWVSLDRPELKLEDEDVLECDFCIDENGERSHFFRRPQLCPDCRGTGHIHGYDSNHVGLPARRVEA